MKYLNTVLGGLFLVGSLIFPSKANAQISRGGWEFKPVVTFTDNIYGLLLGGLCNTSSGLAWFPQIQQRFDTQKFVHTPYGHADVKWWDWGMRNIKAGYSVGYQSRTNPFGFAFSLSYEKRGLQSDMPEDYVAAGGREYIYFNRQTINPELLLKIRLGNYITNRLNPLIEIGGSYNIAVACKGLSKNTESINSGFRGVIGVGFGNTESHLSVTLRYEYDFYNWFNTGWSPDGGLTHPYEGFNSRIGSIMFAASYGF